jgi:ubiquinone/menaquinone biosynthesis C-methylase UbiE
MDQQNCIYEQNEVQQVLGETLRPGGWTLTQRALAYCELPPGARVLDAGCGMGSSVEFFQNAGYRASGIDLSAALLLQGHQRNSHLPLVRASADRLPLASGRFQAVLAECSLSEFSDPGRALDEFWRLLEPRGFLILSDVYTRNPAGMAALREIPAARCLHGAVEQPHLLRLLTRHGFDVKRWEEHTELLKPLAASMICALQTIPAENELDALDVQLAIARAKPGYYLLIARKR